MNQQMVFRFLFVQGDRGVLDDPDLGTIRSKAPLVVLCDNTHSGVVVESPGTYLGSTPLLPRALAGHPGLLEQVDDVLLQAP